jgi:hypothetical protein
MHHAERKPRCEAAEPGIPPEHPGLRGERPVEREHLVDVALAPKNVGAPIFQVFADQALGLHPARDLGQGAQLRGDGVVCELPPDLFQFLRVDEQAVGGSEAGGEPGRLQVLLPVLVVAGPLRQMEGQALGVLETQPQQPRGRRRRARVPDLNGQRREELRALERQPLLVPGGPGGPADAPARAGVGFRRHADDAVFREIQTNQEPVIGGAIETHVVALQAKNEAVGGGAFPVNDDERPALGDPQALCARRVDGPIGELGECRVEKRSKDRLSAVEQDGTHAPTKAKPVEDCPRIMRDAADS